MKKIYIVYTELYGENQIVFDENFKVLGGWSMNDASYRDEYMGGFLKKLGIKVNRTLPPSAPKNLIKDGLKEQFGCTDEELE